MLQVKPKDSQPDEESSSQTDSVASPEAVAEEERPSGITKIPSHTQNEDLVVVWTFLPFICSFDEIRCDNTVIMSH